MVYFCSFPCTLGFRVPVSQYKTRQRFKLFIVRYTVSKYTIELDVPNGMYTSSISIPSCFSLSFIIWVIRYGNTTVPRLVWINWMIQLWPKEWTFIYYQDILSASSAVQPLRWQLAAWHTGMSFIVIVKTLFLHHHTFGQYLIAYTILALVHMFQLSRVSSSFRLLVWQHVQKQLVWYTKVIVLYITKESYCVHFNDCTLSPH